MIYPKDLGPMMMLADIAPGMKVFESGIGSGALSMTLLQAGADIVGYELREDYTAQAKRTSRRFSGPGARSISDRDPVGLQSIEAATISIESCSICEPWQVVPHAEMALKPGGVFMAYTFHHAGVTAAGGIALRASPR
ncbi:MAG: hypothetical protein R2710_24345 [Acidimicrobiales bacterium]